MGSEYEEIQRATKEREDIVAKYDLGREEGAQIDPWEDPAFEVYHVTDRFGFIHDKALPKNVDAAEDKSKQVEKERTTKWLKMIKAWDRYYPGEKLTRRVYKGVPDCLRGEIWSRLLNIPKVKAEQEGIYQRMRNRARTKSTSIRQIDLDVNRTYRNHIMFRERYGVKQQALFHVLAAYSVYNTEIGYCQGMSEVAALLLMYLNEEDAFWGLSQLFVSPRHMMHGSYMHGFPKLLRFQSHHDTVLRKFLPKVRRHLEKNDIFPTLYTIKWFLQCFLDRTPFNLTLRLWDIHMLEGELTLVAMAYCIIKMHRRHIMRMQMDDLLTFFQSSLEKDFVYDSDTVIDQLQICMEELRKAKMSVPPKSKINEQPTLPFGLEIQPSVEQMIGRRTDETLDEHFRKNVQRPGGKAAYLRRKNTGGSLTGGTNLLSTPEMTRSRGGDNRSVHSRISQYSLDEKSSYQDTATNSRMSLTDYSAKNSAPSSRTSFGESSEMGSMSALGHGLASSMDVDDVDDVEVDQTTPTNLPYYSSPASSSSHQVRASSSSETQPSAAEHAPRVRAPSSSETQPSTAEHAPRVKATSSETQLSTAEHAPRVKATSSETQPSAAEHAPRVVYYHRSSHEVRSNYSETQPQPSATEHAPRVVYYHRSPRPGSLTPSRAPATSYHSDPTTPTKSDYHHNTNNRKGSRLYEYEHTPQSPPQDSSPPHLAGRTEKHLDMSPPSSSYEGSTHYASSQGHKSSSQDNSPSHLVRMTELDVSPSSSYEGSTHYTSSQRHKSVPSDHISADRSRRFVGYDGTNERPHTDNFARGGPGSSIPTSKSEGFMYSHRGPEIVLVNGHSGPQTRKMKVTRTENDIQMAGQQDRRKQQNMNFQNGFQGEAARTGLGQRPRLGLYQPMLKMTVSDAPHLS